MMFVGYAIIYVISLHKRNVHIKTMTTSSFVHYSAKKYCELMSGYRNQAVGTVKLLCGNCKYDFTVFVVIKVTLVPYFCVVISFCIRS